MYEVCRAACHHERMLAEVSSFRRQAERCFRLALTEGGTCSKILISNAPSALLAGAATRIMRSRLRSRCSTGRGNESPQSWQRPGP